MTTTYEEFIQSKAIHALSAGMEPSEPNPILFPFQADIVKWALRRGRAAIFADCGLGKTFMQLEWAKQISGKVLILTPIAVAAQTVREAAKLGLTALHVHDGSECKADGIYITNYERLAHFDDVTFEGVVLDESSILKNFMGKTKMMLVDRFAATPFRLCCTATPAPNDYMEIGNHSEFLGVMRSPEMLSRFFINDTMAMGNYRLKGHAEEPFWKWVAGWAVCLGKPSDLSETFSDDGFILPKLNMIHEIVDVDLSIGAGDGRLFRDVSISATNIHREMRLTAEERANRCASIVNATNEVFLVWCNTNYEADALMSLIPDAIEVRGDMSQDEKERKLVDFTEGRIRVLVTKPSIAGFGMNWQHCRNMAFVGLSYSYEAFYQALRRCWRFGQRREVNAHIVMAGSELEVLHTVQQKESEHLRMQQSMYRRINDVHSLREGLKLRHETTIEKVEEKNYTAYLGDCCESIKLVPDASVGLSVFSPPFSNLYIYSDNIQDMGNSANDEEFFQHFGFLAPELLRVTKPGRLAAIHCKQLVDYKGRDGRAGIRDFRGDIIRLFEAHGWKYHSEVTIWKDPVIEMQRTKAHGLLYKQLRADSTFSRQGLAEYIVVMRKWAAEGDEIEPVTHTKTSFHLDQWQQWASPVWMNIKQTNVLNIQAARQDKDEKHICPLQLDVIERCVGLWSNPGDIVLSPFMGIGSEGYMALKMGRRFVGCELKPTYFKQALTNLKAAASATHGGLFSLEEVS